MKATLKAQWIEALRSGRYVQGRYTLKSREPTYCCLGVLADVAGAHWILPTSVKSDYFLAVFAADTAQYYVAVPESLGIAMHVQASLMIMNDSLRNSFHDIAAWIDANVPVDTEGDGQ